MSVLVILMVALAIPAGVITYAIGKAAGDLGATEYAGLFLGVDVAAALLMQSALT